MNNTLIANTITTTLISFFTNTGSEIAKCIGKDLYEKVKCLFRNNEEKEILISLESEPFSIPKQELMTQYVMEKLLDKLFYQEVSLVFCINPANDFILQLIQSTILDIKSELKRLYPWWVNASADKRGEFQNRIEQLEIQLEQLQEKFFSIVQGSLEKNLQKIR